MVNLLAVILSLAMMLTGATGATGAGGATDAAIEPAGRVLTLSDITIMVNDQMVTLNPTAVFGVSTDGKQCVYDFHIDSDGARLLPFQLVADESGLMLVSESSNTTVKITAEEIEQFVSQQLENTAGLSMDSDNAQAEKLSAFIMEEYLPAYADMLALLKDRETLKALQAEGEKAYDALIDRGEGTPGQVDYEESAYDVTTYHYKLTGVEIGKLSDAVYGLNDTLKRYAEVYFRMIQLAAEETPEFKDIDSFEKLFSLIDIEMDVTENIGDEELNISDIVTTIRLPEVEPPVVFNIHSEKLGEDTDATMTSKFTAEDTQVSLFMESWQNADETRMIMTLGITPDDGEVEAEPEVEDADEADIEGADDEEDDIDGEDVEEIIAREFIGAVGDGETESPEGAFFTLDIYSQNLDDDANGYGLSLSANVADIGALGFSLDGHCAGDGDSENQINLYLSDDNADYSLSFMANVAPGLPESHADEANAVPLDQVNGEALLAGLMGDAIKLSAEPSVSQMMAAFSSGKEEEDSAETDVEADVEVEAEDAGPEDAPRSAEPYDDGELSFGMPQFTWLPEGYEVENIEADTQYDMVSGALVNDADNGNIFFYFISSYSAGSTNYFTIGKDGGTTPIEDRIVIENADEDYRTYTCEDGNVSVSLYPSSDSVSAEDICRIIAGITY